MSIAINIRALYGQQMSMPSPFRPRFLEDYEDTQEYQVWTSAMVVLKSLLWISVSLRKKARAELIFCPDFP